MFESRSQSFIN